MSKTAVLVLTHFLDQNILDAFHRIYSGAPEHYDVFLCLNLGSSELQMPKGADAIKERLFLYNTATLLALPYPEKCRPEGWPNRNWLVVDHIDTIILSFYRSHPGYSFYWGVEYDVHYQGEWRFLFERFETSQADLLGTMLHKQSKVPGKTLLPPLRDPEGKQPTHDDSVIGFFPIHRMSNRLLHTLDDEYRQGWNGHFELTLGTIAKRRGLEIEDIGGGGPFVKPHNKNVFYFNTVTRWDMSPGTFVFRPAFTAIQKYANTLWHPVKPTGQYHNHETTTHAGGALNWAKYAVKVTYYRLAIWLWFLIVWRPASSGTPRG